MAERLQPRCLVLGMALALLVGACGNAESDDLETSSPVSLSTTTTGTLRVPTTQTEQATATQRPSPSPVIHVVDSTGYTGDVAILVEVADSGGTETIDQIEVVQEFNFQHLTHAEALIVAYGLSLREHSENEGLWSVAFEDSSHNFVYTVDRHISEYISTHSLAPITVDELGDGRFEIRFTTDSPGRFPLRITATDVDGNSSTSRVPIEIYWSEQPMAIRGVMIDLHWDANSLAFAEKLFPILAKNGVNTVTLNPVLYTEAPEATQVSWCPPIWNEESRCTAPTLGNLQLLVRHARENGMSVILKPHFIIDGYAFAGWQMAPSDWGAWFDSYRERLGEIGSLAATTEAEYVSLGNELGPSHDRKSDWVRIADDLRAESDAMLTYSDPNAWTGSWPGSPDVSFWDALDIIGGPFYYPGSRTNAMPNDSGSDDPTVTEMTEWFVRQIDDLLEPTAEKYGKDVVFLELGTSNFDGSNREPANTDYSDSLSIDEQERVDYYEAALKAVAGYEWVKGAILWSVPLLEDPYLDDPSLPLTHGIMGTPIEDLMRVYFTSS